MASNPKIHKTISEASVIADMYAAIETLSPDCRATFKALVADYGIKAGYKNLCRMISGTDTPATIEYAGGEGEVLALLRRAESEGLDSPLWAAFSHSKVRAEYAEMAKVTRAKLLAQAEAAITPQDNPQALRAELKALNGGKNKLGKTNISDMSVSDLKAHIEALQAVPA